MMFLVSAALAGCPNLDGEIERATVAVVAGDFTTARAALAEGATSFGCAPATTAQAARYWLVEGATQQLTGNTAGARATLAAARAAAPELFDARLGAGVREAWANAKVDGRATLLIEPQRPAFVDGAGVSEWPVTLSATPHLIQLIDGDTVRYGRVVSLDDKEDAVLDTGVAPAPRSIAIATDTKAPVVPKKKKSPALLILAGVAAAGAGACAGGAVLQTPLIEGATSNTDLDGAWTRQQAFGYSTWGLVGVAAVSLGVHIALP